MRLAVLRLVISLVPGVATGQSLPDSLATRVDAVFARYAHADTPGCAVGVFQNGAITYEKGYGSANLEYGIPITPTTLPGNIAMFGGPTNGYLVSPGRYQVRLTVGATTETQPLEVRNDPRVTIAPAEVAARDSMARAINARVAEINDALLRIRDVKDQVTRFVDRAKDAPNAAAITAKGKGIGEKVDTLGPKLSTKAANGQDIINFRNGMNAQYVFLLGNLEGNDVLTQPVRERFAELEKLWGALRMQVEVLEQQDVPEFNKLLEAGKVEGVIVPKPKPKVVM